MIPDHLIDTKALRKLADAATPGPWSVDNMGDLISVPEREKSRYGGHIFIGTATGDATAADEDIEFIIAARTAAPALLDALEQAETERDAVAVTAERMTAYARKAEARIQAVRELHQHGGSTFGDGLEDHTPVCADCLEEWPCPTIRALDGDA